MKSENIVISIIGLITIIVLGILLYSFNSSTTNTTLSVKDLLANSPEVRGNKDSAIKLVDFSDYQCPYCARFNQFLEEEIIDSFGDQVGFYHRHFPLTTIHSNALRAAESSVAASMQDKFWEYNNMLYEKQSEWNKLPNPQDKFAEYAESLGMDKEKFIKDLASPKAISKVKADADAAKALRLAGTPSVFLINENAENEADKIKKIDNPTLEVIKAELNAVVENKVEDAVLKLTDEVKNDILAKVNEAEGPDFETFDNPANKSIENALVEYKITNANTVKVTSVEASDWPDAGLGCLAADQNAAQVVTPGYNVKFVIQGLSFEYHTDQSDNFVDCAKAKVTQPVVQEVTVE